MESRHTMDHKNYFEDWTTRPMKSQMWDIDTCICSQHQYYLKWPSIERKLNKHKIKQMNKAQKKLHRSQTTFIQVAKKPQTPISVPDTFSFVTLPMELWLLTQGVSLAILIRHCEHTHHLVAILAKAAVHLLAKQALANDG